MCVKNAALAMSVPSAGGSIIMAPQLIKHQNARLLTIATHGPHQRISLASAFAKAYIWTLVSKRLKRSSSLH